MIIAHAAVAGQSVVKLYAAAMFPAFPSLAYLVYIVGWALIDPGRCRSWARGGAARAGARIIGDSRRPTAPT